MNFQIFTMYVNDPGLLSEAVRSVDGYADRLVVIDNSPAQALRFQDIGGGAAEIYKPVVPLFCAQTYNLVLDLAQRRGLDAFFLMHSDAKASNEVVAEVIRRAEALDREGERWGVLFTNYDVLCLCNTRVLKDFRWDPYLPLYYTDADYYRRLRLAGVQLVETGLPVEHVGGGSSTLKADPALNHFVLTNYAGWRQYYLLKWGGERDQETYSTPFNR